MKQMAEKEAEEARKRELEQKAKEAELARQAEIKKKIELERYSSFPLFDSFECQSKLVLLYLYLNSFECLVLLSVWQSNNRLCF